MGTLFKQGIELTKVIIEQYGNIEPLYSEEFAELLKNKEKEANV